MAYNLNNCRNSEADSGRKGGRNEQQTTAGGHCYEYNMPAPKGRWFPAYGGDMGKTAKEWDPDIGTAEDETGNDADLDAGGYRD